MFSVTIRSISKKAWRRLELAESCLLPAGRSPQWPPAHRGFVRHKRTAVSCPWVRSGVCQLGVLLREWTQSGGRAGYQEPVTGTAQWGLSASPASVGPTLGEVGRGTCRRASGDQRCKQQEKHQELCLACDEPSNVLEIIVNTLRRTFLESTQMPCRKAHEKLPFKKWGSLKKTPSPYVWAVCGHRLPGSA